MSNSTSSTERALVNKLFLLANDKANRPHLISQGVLPGLMMFLSSTDDEVVLQALETLKFIALHRANRIPMAREPGLAEGLRKVMISSKQEPCRKLAMTIYTNIQDYFAQNANKEKEEASVFSEQVTSKLSVAKTYHINIKGLSDQTKSKLETALLQVKGVVSFFLDLVSQKVVIRSLTSADALISAIKSTGMIVEAYEEHFNGVTSSKKVGNDDENKENSSWWWSSLVPTGDSWWGKSQNENDENTSNNTSGLFGKWGKALWG